MRIKSSNGITIKTPIIKKPIKSKYGRFIPYINFNNENANIIILSYQPGYGKTYTALKYMKQKSNRNTFYFTNRHDTIDERIIDWDPKNKPKPEHWRGFDHTESCKDKRKRSLYRNYKISSKFLCSGCININNCNYRLQFQKKERVFSPVEYLSKEQFKSKINTVKTIFVDERITKVDIGSININDIVNKFNIMGIPQQYIKDIQNRNLFAFNNQRFDHIQLKYDDTIETALNKNDKKTLKELSNFNPSSFKEFFYWGNIYNFNKNKYGIPFYYYVFDAINLNPELKVVILDASFNRDLFKYFLYSFNGEKVFNNKIIVQEYTTKERNNNTIVFRMKPKAWHPKKSFITEYDDKHTEKWVPYHINKIRNIFGDKNVGIITFKELGEQCKFLGFNVEYYGNLRSKNTFEKTPILIILGHFFPPMIETIVDKDGIKKKGLEEIIDEWFLRDKSSYSIVELKDFINKKLGKKSAKAKKWRERYFGDSWPRRYADEWGKTQFKPRDPIKLYPAKTVQDYFDDEIYQAVHRNRGLQNTRIIFLYCWIPPYTEKKYLAYGGEHLHKIMDEFDFRRIEDDEVDEFFESLKLQIGDRTLVNNMMDDIAFTDKSNKNIASDNKIYRKKVYKNIKPNDGSGGPASFYVQIIRKGIYGRNQQEKVKNSKYKINFPP